MDANAQDLVVSLPIIDSLGNRPAYLPLSVPEQLAPKLTMYHGNPPVWWIGQLVNYVMRPQAWLAEEIENFEKKIEFRHPIVGYVLTELLSCGMFRYCLVQGHSRNEKLENTRNFRLNGGIIRDYQVTISKPEMLGS